MASGELRQVVLVVTVLQSFPELLKPRSILTTGWPTRFARVPWTRLQLPNAADANRDSLYKPDSQRGSTLSETPIETDVQTVQSLLSENADFLLLDCREPPEFETAKIEGATLLPMSEIQNRIGELTEEKERHIVVHCHHGGRSLQVAQWMRQQGFPHVQSMAGGIDLWSQVVDSAIPRY